MSAPGPRRPAPSYTARDLLIALVLPLCLLAALGWGAYAFYIT